MTAGQRPRCSCTRGLESNFGSSNAETGVALATGHKYVPEMPSMDSDFNFRIAKGPGLSMG